MASIDFPEGNYLTPGAYANLKTETGKTKSKNLRGAGKVQFSHILETAEETGKAETLRELPPSEEALQELLDEVHSAGDSLKARPFTEEIKQYKRAVRNFLHYVVENGYTLEAQDGIPNAQKPGYTGSLWEPKAKDHKKYYTVQVIDQKLEQLAAGILNGQITQLNLLARLEEINGLLVNLLQG